MLYTGKTYGTNNLTNLWTGYLFVMEFLLYKSTYFLGVDTALSQAVADSAESYWGCPRQRWVNKTAVSKNTESFW